MSTDPRFLLPELTAQRWGTDAASARSLELTPLYVDRFVGPRHDTKMLAHEVWELTYVFKGVGVLHGDVRHALAPGVVTLIPPGLMHREESSAQLDTLWIALRGTRLVGMPQIAIMTATSEELAPLFEQLWLRTLASGSNGAELDGIAQTIFARFVSLRNEGSTIAGDGIDRAIEYLHRHYARRIAVPLLAQRFGYSDGHFFRSFKRRTGLTPLAYLTAIRLRHARDVMRRSTLPLARIARMVGYDDPLYFSRVFRKHEGRSPRLARLD